MRITAIVAFVAVVHIGSASIAAQQPTDGLRPKGNPLGNLFALSSKPPSPPRFLFPTPTPTPTLNQPSDPRVAAKPTVVCGLTLIPADPNVDRAIRHEVPEDGPRFLIRSVDPRICRRP
ncbi:MAG TPA: hypothetical protein VGQ37_25290 [Vicinamibacterales bacterium]|jgi:hypothetical protein|nr:hypothetical protein [Vicinamibacterales bacterium]